MSPEFESQILKEGDHAGNRMVAKYTVPGGLVVHAVGVPQSWNSPLGPTWCYLIAGDVLTVIDTGSFGCIQYLEEGLDYLGYSLEDLGRVVITHGHMDHDGNCAQVLSRSGAELWAHEVYKSLVGVPRHGVDKGFSQRYRSLRPMEDEFYLSRIGDYEEGASQVVVAKAVTDGLTSDGFTFYYTPGHSPDELCILYEGILFSGDHVLPQITPHPSMNQDYAAFRQHLPEHYHSGNRYFGLKVYLQSLKRVSTMEEDLVILPAHRAYYRYQFNPIGPKRALDIVDHHLERCQHMIDLLRSGPMDPVEMTRKYFPQVRARSRHFYIAFTEILAHLEMLEEAGDVAMMGDDRELAQWTGTDSFASLIDAG